MFQDASLPFGSHSSAVLKLKKVSTGVCGVNINLSAMVQSGDNQSIPIYQVHHRYLSLMIFLCFLLFDEKNNREVNDASDHVLLRIVLFLLEFLFECFEN